MTILKGLAAAALLALSVTAATACDDYEDQMALAAAIEAAKLASTQQRAEPSAQAPPQTVNSSVPADVAATEPKPSATQTTENLAGTRRQ